MWYEGVEAERGDSRKQWSRGYAAERVVRKTGPEWPTYFSAPIVS